MRILSLVLFAVLIALQLADAYLTWRVLAAGGRELNPIMRALIDRLGAVAGLGAGKVALVVAAWLFILEQPIALALLVALYGWVGLHNWRQINAKTRKA